MQCTMKTKEPQGRQQLGVLFFIFFLCVFKHKHAVYDEDPWTQKDTIIGKFSVSWNMHAAAAYEGEKMY